MTMSMEKELLWKCEEYATHIKLMDKISIENVLLWKCEEYATYQTTWDKHNGRVIDDHSI